MYYSILIYAQEGVWERLTEQEQEAALEQHRQLQAECEKEQTLGPVVRLGATSGAVTVRQRSGKPMTLDGPFAETKEHLLGIYMVKCSSIDEAIAAAKKLPQGIACYEVRPVMWSNADQ